MDTADVLIHIHPELSADERNKLVDTMLANKGVMAASFDHHEHPHALTVVYDPDAVHGAALLEVARKVSPTANMVGL